MTTSSPTVRLTRLASVTASLAIYSSPAVPWVIIAVSVVRSLIRAQSISAVRMLALATAAMAAESVWMEAHSMSALAMLAVVS